MVGNSSSSANDSMGIARVTRDIFDHRYYRLGKILMLLTGQWPYQSILARCGIIAAGILFMTYQAIDEPLTVVKYRNDWDILMECFTPYIFEAVVAAKYFNSRYNSRKILKLLDRIRTDWQVWARHPEVTIIHVYAERGEKITTVYAAWMYFVIFVFAMQPMITKLIDIVLNNGTKPAKFPIPVAYDHVDVEKYYFYIIIYIGACGLLLMTDLMSNEVMLILYVHHVCGIFAAVGHKLDRIRGNYTSAKAEGSPYALDKEDTAYLVLCIDRHNDAIEYADLIKSSYEWDLFFTLGFGMILVNVVGLQMLLKTSDLGATATLVGLALGTLLVFYVECHISQILINHSISVGFCIQNSEWYKLAPKNQKILQFMMMRCNIPCQLMAGNMLTMSLQNFGMALRSAMSYFAFMRSTQGI